ncbi:uncharacterized protein LOC112525740 [Cynara cardunculus var. scolymus]|uniref:Uncharacterized protein n=1 Tax=Cynara cardunculus var. scolymus TaxID=59895 RepID=A0A103Y893_CYNCS|nr:uncharacterized protein LOC112525740 [Cynara cardunculus var. scolymus]KVI04344.1 hypothetical protein Ccrd_017346 [Cynara cardunculus var. scolymus]
MDFHSLTRRELQSLCKLNKIPANITNVAMADALQSLQTVEGIEEFLNVSQSETDGLVEPMEKVEVSSPKAPQTRCRTSTRQKVKNGDGVNLPPTATRTTRRGSKQLTADVEDSKSNMVKTPAIASTRRKALATSSCRNVNNRLNECEEEAKKESTVQKAYSTRRSTRLTEKKSAEPEVKKESEKAIKMNSFVDEMDVLSKVDEVNVTSEEVCELDEAPENTVGSGMPNAEVADICKAFEKLDVLINGSAPSSVLEKDVDIEVAHKNGEEKDCGELDNLKLESDETPNPSEDGDLEGKLMIEEKFDLGEKFSSEEAENDEVFDQKTELDGISSPCEDDDSEEKLDSGEKFDATEVSSKEISGDNLSASKDHDLVMAPEEDSDSFESGDEEVDIDTPFNTENLSGAQEFEQEDMLCAVSEMKDQVLENNEYSSLVSDMVLSITENPSEAFESDNFSTADEITKNDMEQVSQNMVDETLDVIPAIDNTITAEEVQDLKLFTEFREFPSKKTPIKTPTSFKNTSRIVSDDKENIDSGRKLQNVFVDEGKKSKKEKDENDKVKSLHEISMRQLRKQVKALTLKNLNAHEDAAAKEAATRPALQVLCENQLVGGETKK